MVCSRRVWSVSLALMLAATAVTSADNNNLKAFEKTWTGRRVVVKRPLYSLIYNEHGRGNSIKSGKSGLTVVTPFAGMYYQFDGRRHVDDVVEQDVTKIPAAVSMAYLKSKALDEGFTQEIEPVTLTFYDKGFELTVSAARVERDTVRLTLVQASGDEDDIATSLTVKWPVPLSKSFSERGNVEDLIQQFLTARD